MQTSRLEAHYRCATLLAVGGRTLRKHFGYELSRPGTAQ
jgi:hypothetical protein